jgi:hypothetical protein
MANFYVITDSAGTVRLLDLGQDMAAPESPDNESG